MSEQKEKWKRQGYSRIYRFTPIPNLPDTLLLTVDSEFKVTNITEEPQSYYAKMEFEADDHVSSVSYRLVIDGKDKYEGVKPLVKSDTRRDVLEARSPDVTVDPGVTLTALSKWAFLVGRKGGDMISFGKPVEGLYVGVVTPDDLDFLAEFATPPDKYTEDGGGQDWHWDRTFVEWQHVNVRWWPR